MTPDKYNIPINEHMCSPAVYNLFGAINCALYANKTNFAEVWKMLKDIQGRGNSDKTSGVLIAYYKDAGHLHWILQNNIYNTRINFEKNLNKTPMQVEFILLHNNKLGCKTFRLKHPLPNIIEAEKLPKSDTYFPNHSHYLIYYLGNEITMKREKEIKDKLFQDKEPYNPFIIKIEDLW